jgi:flagellar hook-length control protein FliK
MTFSLSTAGLLPMAAPLGDAMVLPGASPSLGETLPTLAQLSVESKPPLFQLNPDDEVAPQPEPDAEHGDANISDGLMLVPAPQDKLLPWIDIDGPAPAPDKPADGPASPAGPGHVPQDAPKPGVIKVSSSAQPLQALDMARLAALVHERVPQAAAVSMPMVQVPSRRDSNQPASLSLPAGPGVETAESVLSSPAARPAGTDSSSFATLPAISPSTVRVEGTHGKASAMLDATTEHKLLGALGERIHVQARQGMQSAVIDLAPYMAGNVRIELRHEAGALQVRISASHPEVTQQLQAISDGLRQELSNRQFHDVAVQIGHGRHADHGGRGGQPQQGQDGETPHQSSPGRALAADTSDEAFDTAWTHANESKGYQA